MAQNRRRFGDRREGRLLRSLPGFNKFIPFIMPQRNDRFIHYEESFEITALDRRLSFAADVFYSKYKDQQVTTQVAVPSGIASSVDNAGSSTIYGAEFEGQAALGAGFSANLALGYIHAEYDEFNRYDPVSKTIINVADQYVFQNTPKWTGSLGVTWRHELFGGDVSVTPTVSYRGSYTQFEQPLPTLDQKAFTLLDLTAIWTSPDQRYKFSLTGKNLTDERYRIGGYNFPGATYNNSVIGFYGPPRTILGTVEVKF